MNPKTHFLTVQSVTNWGTEGGFLGVDAYSKHRRMADLHASSS